jgi:hypothetical protein
MQKFWKISVVVSLIGAVIFIFGSCQHSTASENKITKGLRASQLNDDNEIFIEATEDKGEFKWRIKTYEVPLSKPLTFKVKAHKAARARVWLLFPANFDFVEGSDDNTTFCSTKDLLAVRFDSSGYATIAVPERFADPEKSRTVRYSVMISENDGHGWTDWYYAHGPESPPGMIIPKKHG